LHRIAKHYKTCLLMRKMHGMTPGEIAKALGLTQKTVQRYLIRAIAYFKSEFTEP